MIVCKFSNLFNIKGKSLSLICGALTWLEHYDKKKQEEIESILSGKAKENGLDMYSTLIPLIFAHLLFLWSAG